ncbi:MAG TPA: Rne/Rng family ribonuclease, partial [Gemmatales bacterium]|nr:Rne/Rng family ribonuclease [Gemmatales bacterium]
RGLSSESRHGHREDRRGVQHTRRKYTKEASPLERQVVETPITESSRATQPPTQTFSEPAHEGFGFGILFEPAREESNTPTETIISEPIHELRTGEVHDANISLDENNQSARQQSEITDNLTSFHSDENLYNQDEIPPVEVMPSAKQETSEALPELESFDVSFSSMQAPSPVSTEEFSFPKSDDSNIETAEENIPSFHKEEPVAAPFFDRGEEPESAIPTFNREIVDEPISFDENSGNELEVEPQRFHRTAERRSRTGSRDGSRGGLSSRSRDNNYAKGDRRTRRNARDFGRDGPNAAPKPPIQEIFRRGQEVLVQVIKEGIGTKGPTLSTYISIPGRYLVVMPGLSRIGVSRKIGDEQQRRRLRTILQDLRPPRGLGFIIRTAGLDRTKKELQRDLAYLTRLWRVIATRIQKGRGPAPIYQESDIITRTIRDIFTNQIEKIRVDEPVSYQHAKEFMQFVMPRYADRLELEDGLEPLFHRYGIEAEIGNIQNKRVPLANGGSLVIDQTEALVAIDVNSGQFRQENDAEENAYQMNLAAAREVARQLRLRDLGGVIIIDFIDMRDERHRREIEHALRVAISRDRARTKVLRMSQFGIIQMTRQRIRPSLKRTNFDECPACRATGLVKTGETMSIEVMRMLQLAAWRPNVSRVRIRVAETLAQYLLNRKRKEIARLEDEGKIQVTILGVPGALPETLDIQCLDEQGGEIRLTRPPEAKKRNSK